MAENVKDVPISNSADKRLITASFAETLDGSFLPFRLIYKTKTTQSLPKTDCPDGFSLSVNENILAILKNQSFSHLLTKKDPKNNPSKTTLLIWDVFRGQKTTLVLDILKENNIIT